MTVKKSATSDTDPRDRLKKILPRLEKSHPDAKLDLDFTNPLELLISLILAAQARDDLVCKITPALFKANRSAADYAKLPLADLETQIGKINFYRNKAKSIHNCCVQLVERFGGKVPDNLADLVSLPGSAVRQLMSSSATVLASKPSASTPMSCAYRSGSASRPKPIRTRSKPT